jgi:ferrous iron transport protein A
MTLPSSVAFIDALPAAVEPFTDTCASALTLDNAPQRVPFAVHALVYAGAQSEWPQRLEELGFLPGERVMVLTRGWPGGDPVAVRVGHSAFALRRAEAACVQLRPW